MQTTYVERITINSSILNAEMKANVHVEKQYFYQVTKFSKRHLPNYLLGWLSSKGCEFMLCSSLLETCDPTSTSDRFTNSLTTEISWKLWSSLWKPTSLSSSASNLQAIVARYRNLHVAFSARRSGSNAPQLYDTTNQQGYLHRNLSCRRALVSGFLLSHSSSCRHSDIRLALGSTTFTLKIAG